MTNHYKKYIFGFIISIALTLLAYYLTVNQTLSGGKLLAAIISLAFIQALVQLIFFLHLGQEERPKWNIAVFISTVSVIFIVLAGSIWIMNNLNYRHAGEHEINHIFEQEAIPKK